MSKAPSVFIFVAEFISGEARFNMLIPNGVFSAERRPLGPYLAFEGILTGIPIDLPISDRYAGHRLQLFGDGNGNRVIPIMLTYPDNLVADCRHINPPEGYGHVITEHSG